MGKLFICSSDCRNVLLFIAELECGRIVLSASSTVCLTHVSMGLTPDSTTVEYGWLACTMMLHTLLYDRARILGY